MHMNALVYVGGCAYVIIVSLLKIQTPVSSTVSTEMSLFSYGSNSSSVDERHSDWMLIVCLFYYR